MIKVTEYRVRKMPGEKSDDVGLTWQQEVGRELVEIVDRLRAKIESRSSQLPEN